ncbi:MAG TPA: hypothetical protein PKD00_10570 [Burkholderiales bacterium]|nr:hypothetical protein [Burkholderiales bacterium]
MERTKLDILRSRIADECIDSGGFNQEEVENLAKFFELAKDSYVLVSLQDSLKYREEEWFEKEAIFTGEIDATNVCYYCIPLKRLL